MSTRLIFGLIGFLCYLTVRGQDSLFNIATDLFQQAEYDEALQVFREAGDQYRQDERFEEYATCSLEMAACHTRLAAYNSSIAYARNVVSYVDEVLPENQLLKAQAARIIGESYLNLGRNEEALEQLLIAEDLYPKTSLVGLDECYNLLGLTYMNNGNEILAAQYHRKALALRLGRFGENSLEAADSYNNIGLIYIEKDPAEAVSIFQKVLDIYQNAYGKDHPKVAFAMINLANAKSNQGQYFDAISLITQVQEIWDRTLPDVHPNKAFTHSTYGRMLMQQNNLKDALHQQELALQMYVQLYGEKHPEVANTHFLVGSVYQRQEEYREALDAYHKAIFANLPGQISSDPYQSPRLNPYLNADYLLSALLAKAKALEALHFEKTLRPRDLLSAITTYQIADTLVNEIRKIRSNETDKIRLGETSRLIYENGIRLSLVMSDQPFVQQKHLRNAFRFAERSKAAVLASAIQDTQAKSFAGIPSGLLNQEDSLNRLIIDYKEKIARSQDIDKNRDLLFEVESAYRDLIQYFETEYPRYYELKYMESTITLNSFQRRLKDHQTVLMYYQGSESLYLFVITNRTAQVEIIEDVASLKSQISALRNGLKYNIDKALHSSATYLNINLIPKLPPQTRHLIILPDGILNAIPFEVLKDEITGRYLVQDMSVSYDFSASLMVQRQELETTSSSKALLVAPVSFEEAGMVTLPGTQKEINDIMYLFKTNDIDSERLVEEDALESSIKSSSLNDYRYLHLATHGLVNESKPELSRIFLKADTLEDGSLYSGDIYTLSINADLVSLSACETGLGKVEQGEGILGLSRALLFAGSRNLLVSQWKVSDESTTLLMHEFYHQHLLTPEKVSFHKALRKAKLFLLEQEAYQSPYYWAPFVLVGQ